MICPHCGAMVPEGRNSCINCGKNTQGQQMDAFSREDRSRLQRGNDPEGFWGTKGGIILAGSGEVGIGLFGAILITLMIAQISFGIGLIAGLIFFIYGAGLPLIGILLIAVGQHTLGGNILIAGSVLMVPAGRLGIWAGRNAKRLDGWTPY